MAPAAAAVALAVGVLVALEAFEDVVAVGIAGLGRGFRGMAGALARAAKEHQQGLGHDAVLEGLQEMRDSEKPTERFAFKEYISEPAKQLLAERDAKSKEKKAAAKQLVS